RIIAVGIVALRNARKARRVAVTRKDFYLATKCFPHQRSIIAVRIAKFAVAISHVALLDKRIIYNPARLFDSRPIQGDKFLPRKRRGLLHRRARRATIPLIQLGWDG